MGLVELQIAPVTRLTLNDPQSRNAMSEEMATEFHDAVGKILSSSEPRVVVLSGAGEAFSGGGHLSMLEKKTKLSRYENEQKMMEFYHAFLSLIKIPVPVIAAINGHAVGAGCCLTLACDIRVAVSGAKLGFNFVSLGLHPGMGATFFLPRIVGPAIAAELLYSGAIIQSESALNLKLVNSVYNQDQFQGQVTKLAEKISANGPQSVKELKKSLIGNLSRELEDALRVEAQHQAGDYIGAEFLEGITAAKEKRPARFS